MPESDSAATQTAKISEMERHTVPGITDPYLREQLEKRRDELKIAISTIPLAEDVAGPGPLRRPASKKSIQRSNEWTRERMESAMCATILSRKNGSSPIRWFACASIT